MFTAALSSVAKTWKQPKCTMGEWKKKNNVVYTSNEISLSLNEEGNPAICDFIDGPGGMPSEMCQTQKTNSVFISLI